MQNILFGSFNAHKCKELKQLLSDGFAIKSCAEIEGLQPVVELSFAEGGTFEKNATLKAQYYSQQTGLPCLADDSGLEVFALKGAPGVDTAYYAGVGATAQANNQLLLENMQGIEDRRAKFICVLAYIDEQQNLFLFKGELMGEIAFFPTGVEGFGYDPIFIPAGFQQSLAECGPQLKNKISHRAIAMQKFIEFIILKS